MSGEQLVSVIMPAYNCELYIKQAVDSILNQTYANLELLICDDGSSDNTVRVIESFKDPRIRVFKNQENIGNLKTRNMLFELAKGEFIAVQDADDWSSPNRIESQLNILHQDQSLGACFTSYLRVSPAGEISSLYAPLSQNIETGVEFEGELPFPMASIMLRRRVYQDVGGLNPFFDRLFGEDHYWVYLIREKYKTICLKEPLYHYRFNPDSLTNSIDNLRKLSVIDTVHFLLAQRKERGTDFLEEKRFDELKRVEESFLNSKKWLAEKYRLYAAVKIDANNFGDGCSFLFKSFKLNPFSLNNLRTLSYLLRKRFNIKS